MKKSISSSSVDEIDFPAIGRIIWRYKLLIVATTAVTALSSLAISFVLPKTFTSEATILPMAGSDPAGAIAAGLASQLGSAAGMLGGIGLGGTGKSADLVEILSSRSMAERVIAKCGLDHELSGWKTHGDLVSRVLKMTKIVAPTVKSKAIAISVQAPNAELSARIANTYVDELKDMLDGIGYNSAAKNRKFIEGQLSTTKDDLTKAEDRLTTFQAANHLASLPDTVVASIKSISDLEAQRIGAAVQVKSADEALGVIKSKVSTLQADPNSLVDLEIKRKGYAAQEEALARAKEMFLNKLSSLPPKGMELARLQRDVQVQNAIYLALNQQYEAAVISENKDSDAFLPLDKADVPDRPSKPKKLLNMLAGMLAGLLAGIFYVVLKHYPRGFVSDDLTMDSTSVT